MLSESRIQLEEAIEEVIYRASLVAAGGMVVQRDPSVTQEQVNRWMNSLLNLNASIAETFELCEQIVQEEELNG